MERRARGVISPGSPVNICKGASSWTNSSPTESGSMTSTKASPPWREGRAFARSSCWTDGPRPIMRFNHPPLLASHIEAEHRMAKLGDLELESGEILQDYAQSYVTHGKLNAAESNAVLVCISLTGNHHRLDFLIGPGRALDPARYFIVVADPIGNGLSTSPSNSPQQPGMRFPRFTIRDMVESQYRLLTRHCGLASLHAVIGASMGGMQALQWAVSYPQFMSHCVAMTAMAKTSAWSVLVTETARCCLMADPAWTGEGFNGAPQRGWRAYTGLMTALFSRTPEALGEFLPDCAEAHLWFEKTHAQNRKTGFDAHDYLYQSWAYEAHDLGMTSDFHSDTAQALASIKAKTLLLGPSLDLFNPAQGGRDAAASIHDAQFIEVPSLQGHLAATSAKADDAAFLNRVITQFLNEMR